MLNDDSYVQIYTRNTNSPLPNESFSNYCIDKNSLTSMNITNIYLYQPHMRIQHIKVKSDRPISTLSRQYVSDMAFIFNGQILDKEKTFSDYAIVDGSKIVMLPEEAIKNDLTFKEKWLNITSDKENFDKKIEISVNSVCRKEISRLNDIKYQKLEMKRRTHSFFVNSRFGAPIFNENSSNSPFLSSCDQGESKNGNLNKITGVSNLNIFFDLYKKGNNKCNILLNVDYEKNDAPLEVPLPVMW